MLHHIVFSGFGTPVSRSHKLNRITNDHGHSAQLNMQLAAAMAKDYHLSSRAATIEIGENSAVPTRLMTATVSGWIPSLRSRWGKPSVAFGFRWSVER
jgi:hypothetical protein